MADLKCNKNDSHANCWHLPHLYYDSKQNPSNLNCCRQHKVDHSENHLSVLSLKMSWSSLILRRIDTSLEPIQVKIWTFQFIDDLFQPIFQLTCSTGSRFISMLKSMRFLFALHSLYWNRIPQIRSDDSSLARCFKIYSIVGWLWSSVCVEFHLKNR